MAQHDLTNTTPAVSIGMPVFNGGAYIRGALDSLLAQTFADFELVISDNASTDNTQEICREYASKDPRIRYVRQSENIGALRNFRYVLDGARAAYFKWAACDDVISVDFVEKNFHFLETNPDYVASTSPVRFEGGDFDPIAMGDASLNSALPGRIANFFSCWHANGRYYSLMRTDVIRMSPYLNEDFLGSDWASMLYVIFQGKTNRHCQGFVLLGRNGFSNSGNILKHYRISLIHWFVPFFELSKAALRMSKGFPMKYKSLIIISLFEINILAIWRCIKPKRSIRHTLYAVSWL